MSLSDSKNNIGTPETTPANTDREVASVHQEMSEADFNNLFKSEFSAPTEVSPEDDDSVLSYVKDNIIGAAAGFGDAIQETGNLVLDVADFVTGDDLIDDDFRITTSDDIFGESKSLARGGAVRAVTNFLFPFSALNKLSKGAKFLKGMGKLSRAAAIGAAVDFAAFDPEEKRLSDLVQQTGVLPEAALFLATGKDDSRLEGRFKNMVEGLMLGGVTDAVATVLGKGIKAYRGAKEASIDAAKETGEKFAKVADEVDTSVKPKGETPAQAELRKATEFEASQLKENNAEAYAAKQVEKEQKQEILDRFFLERTDAKLEILPQLNKVEDVDRFLREHVKNTNFRDEKLLRGAMTLDEIKASSKEMMEELGLDETFLLAREQKGVYNAEEIFAAFDIIKKAGNDVVEIAKLTKNSTDPTQHAAFTMAIETYKGLRKSFEGAASEAGRSFRALQEVRGGSLKEMQNTLDRLVSLNGGSEQVKELAREFSTINGSQVSKSIKKAGLGKNLLDAIIETRTAGLLSGPTTHLVNAFSNAIVVVSNIAERAGGAALSLMRGNLDIALEESGAMMKGLTAGFGDAIKIAKDSFKSGDSLFGGTFKGDVIHTPALSGDAFGVTGPGGEFLDKLGSFIRLPFNALQASDNFFKQLHYSMEVHSQAARKVQTVRRLNNAAGKEFSSDLAESVYKEVIKNPSEEIAIAAKDHAKYSTFNQPAGKMGQALVKLRDSHPIGKILVPFINTNVNLMKFSIERTPFAAVLPEVRQALKAGGREADMALSKIGMGSGFMALGASMVVDGKISGAGPSDHRARKMLEATGWKPYSLNIGGKWVEYKRIEPFGKILGLTADLVNIAGAEGSEERSALDGILTGAAAGLGSLFNPEFLTQNIVSVQKALEDPLSKSGRHFISGTAASFIVPYSSAARSARKVADPIKRVSLSAGQEGFLSLFEDTLIKVQNTLPWMSKELPPVTNIFGDPVVYAPGSSLNTLSPMAISANKKTPIANEIRALGIDDPYEKNLTEEEKFLIVGQIPQTIKMYGKSVKLNPKEYSELQRLAGGHGLEGYKKTLEETLNEIVSEDFYKEGSRMEKIALIKQIITDYRAAAKVQYVINNPHIEGMFLGE